MQTNLKFFRIAMLLLFTMIVGGVSAQTITGNVKDATGEDVIGATIMETGTKNGTVTDFDGNFTLKLTAGKKEITVSYVGMKTQTVNIAGKTSVNVVLQDDETTLQDVVVVGYGTMKKSDLTGSVSSVNTDQLNAKGAASVLGNLQGSNPGVNITQTSGRNGTDFNIEIRGKSSMNSSTTPLYVVDGVMCDDINFLNPQDIERIDILKDASSTAIYGSRATAGVVVVTTKGGLNVKKDQKPTISYDGYYGWSQIARMPEFTDGESFYQYRFFKFLQYRENQGNIPVANPTYQISGSVLEQCLLREEVGAGAFKMKEMLASGKTYDWPSLVTQNGSQQNHFISVNGSTESVSYHFGAGYNGETGTYKGDAKSQVNFKGSVDAKINKVISAGFSMNMARVSQEYANDYAIQNAYYTNPYMVPYDENGRPTYKPGNYETLGTTSSYQFSDAKNPLNLMQSTSRQRETWRVLGNIYLKLDLMKGLDVKTTFSPNYRSYRDGFFGGYVDPVSGRPYDDGSYTEENPNEAHTDRYRSFAWTWDNTINYNTTINNDHNVGVMGLFSMESSNSERSQWYTNGVMDLTDWWNMGSGTFDATNSSTSYSENSMMSYALRANYGYKNRYLLTATIRWDADSRFDKDHRWGAFPSAAFAWRITEEEFMKPIDWISNLKLRLSYGKTGNNKGAGAYATQQTLSSPIYYPFGGTYEQGYTPSSVVNKVLKWETSEEYNLGLDFGFLNGRINGSVDIYQKTSDNLLRAVSLPLESGGGSMTTNIGSVRNRGIEVALTTVNVQNKDWNWETTFTFAHNQNKVRNIDGIVDRLVGTGVTGNLFVDYCINNTYTYKVGGIVSDRNMTVPDNEAARIAGLTPGSTMKEYDYYFQVYGLTEGQPYVVDVDGNGKIDNDDRVIRNMDPAWTGSFTSNLSYKNWDFSFSLYAKMKYEVFSNFLDRFQVRLDDRGQQKLAGDWYIPAGTLIDVDGVNPDGTYINPVYQTTTHYGELPFPNNGGSNAGVGAQSSYWKSAQCVTDASFLKVKNITLGYTFPKTLLSKFGCNSLRLYATVTNPFVITGYKGFDPEWADASLKYDGPSTVTYQVGASIKF